MKARLFSSQEVSPGRGAQTLPGGSRSLRPAGPKQRRPLEDLARPGLPSLADNEAVRPELRGSTNPREGDGRRRRPVASRAGGRVRRPAARRQLADLVSIGPAMLRDFALLGIHSVAQLARQNPQQMYVRLSRKTGQRQDPCVLDTFHAAVAQARNPRLPAEQCLWWYWSKKRKNEQKV
jgi:hypothetical protein